MAKTNFMQTMKEKARESKKTIVLPESEDTRVLKAAQSIIEEKIAKVLLIGEPEEIQKRAKAAGISLDEVDICNPANADRLSRYAKEYVRVRSSKKVSLAKAKKILSKDWLSYGAIMVEIGDAHGMVAGASHYTPDVLRPALQILKTSGQFVSSFCVMDIPDCSYGAEGVFLFADCGMNQNPMEEELARIAKSSSDSFSQLLEREPEVAMISYSTNGSACHEMVDKVRSAVHLAKAMWPELKVDGEMQVDAAIVPEIAKQKMPGSSVAGRANILVFPNLDVGNAACKLVERLAKARMYGPILQGLRKPVNDLSRGCSVDDIVGVAAITAVQAENCLNM